MPRHKIIGSISRGRTTEILRGVIVHPEGLGSEIAIKRLHKEFSSNEAMVQAFLNEARVGVALRHDNVVDVLRASSADDQPEIIMQYLQGWSLDSIGSMMRARKKALDVEIAVAICHAAACGAAHIHEHGLVHRHITPGNVMVTQGGCTKLIDFGGAISGPKKPASRYTAPEFFLERKALDARGDVYAIGAILYELTTGVVLFQGGNPSREIVEGYYEPPSRVRDDYPGLLAAILKRCMALDPAKRYQSADALLEALEHFASDSRYTLSSRIVRCFASKNFNPPSRVEEEAKLHQESKLTTIHFQRVPEVGPPPVPNAKASPPPVPDIGRTPPPVLDLQLTRLDTAVG